MRCSVVFLLLNKYLVRKCVRSNNVQGFKSKKFDLFRQVRSSHFSVRYLIQCVVVFPLKIKKASALYRRSSECGGVHFNSTIGIFFPSVPFELKFRVSGCFLCITVSYSKFRHYYLFVVGCRISTTPPKMSLTAENLYVN